MPHPLDRPVWSALTARQRGFAVGDPQRALRFHPDVNVFAAAADRTAPALAALAELIPPAGAVGLVEREPWPLPPGTTGERRPALVQMVAEQLAPGPAVSGSVALGADDAEEMVALARMTEPGPFFSRTHELGDFIGVRAGGRLVAMAGERMKLAGFTELSAVCTHPDHRGRGLAGGLMRVVANRIRARGETPFLHSYAANAGAMRLYESLGFRVRTEMAFTILRRV